MSFDNLKLDPNTLNELMQTAKNMQEKMLTIQQQLTNTKIQGEAASGTVKVIMNGRYAAEKVMIDPTLIKIENKKVIEDLLVMAINDATRKIEKLSQDKLMGLSTDTDKT